MTTTTRFHKRPTDAEAEIEQLTTERDEALRDAEEAHEAAHALELKVAQLRAPLDALIKASKHPHKGPHDTDGTMLTTAALRTIATIVDTKDKP